MTDLTADLTCPRCETTFSMPFSELRPGVHLQCPHCQADIELSGDDPSQVQRAVDRLDKAFAELNKKMRRP